MGLRLEGERFRVGAAGGSRLSRSPSVAVDITSDPGRASDDRQRVLERSRRCVRRDEPASVRARARILWRWLWILGIGVAAFAALTGCATTPVSGAATNEITSPRLDLSSRRIALGVTVLNAPGELSVLQNYIGLAGRAPAIVMYFRGFDEPLFYSTEERNLRLIDATPMVTWGPDIDGVGLSLAAVAAGRYDSYLQAEARAAKRWGRLMYIRFAHEMNLQASPWGPGRNGNTPALYVAAWRRVVSVFRQEHVTNVRWVWSPNVDCQGHCRFAAYYPGNAWVDDVGLDGYNFAAAHGDPWISFTRLFGPSYALTTAISDKPVMITETAAPEVGGNKASWIKQAFLHDIPAMFPRLVAVVWWDRRDQTGDWRVNSSVASLRAWREVVASALYRG
jgi:hypothetical protein